MCHYIHDVIANRHKYPEFTDAIETHFRLKKDYIIKTCKKWVDDTVTCNGNIIHHSGKLDKDMMKYAYKKVVLVLESL